MKDELSARIGSKEQNMNPYFRRYFWSRIIVLGLQ
jgi:hypothetical protein